MWTWDQRAGAMSRDGKVVCHGYSGHDYGINNPDADAVPGIGPLPKGQYKMTALVEHGASTGPYTIDLEQVSGDSHGRSAFRIHGDNFKMDRSASHGCIILPPSYRHEIWESGDHDLEVIA
jgi:hypothetical protein